MRILLAIAAALACSLCGSCSWSTSPEKVRIAFEAKEPADLWLNGAKVGPLPRTFELHELEPYFLAEFHPSVGSVQAMDRAVESAMSGAGGSAQSGSGATDDEFHYRTWKRAQDQDEVWLVRGIGNKGGTRVPTAGGFRVRVVAADGTVLEPQGTSGHSAAGVSTDTATYGRKLTEADLEKLKQGTSEK